MATEYSFGLKVDGLKIGNIAIDGGLATTLVSPGSPRENTVKVTPSDSSDTDFYKEGDDSAPAITITKKGVTMIEYDLLTFDPEVIADLTGGSTTGTGENIIYSEPVGSVIVEKSHVLTDKQGRNWTFPRTKITAHLIGVFTNTDVNVVRVKAKVMMPKKAGTSSFSYGKPA